MRCATHSWVNGQSARCIREAHSGDNSMHEFVTGEPFVTVTSTCAPHDPSVVDVTVGIGKLLDAVEKALRGLSKKDARRQGCLVSLAALREAVAQQEAELVSVVADRDMWKERAQDVAHSVGLYTRGLMRRAALLMDERRQGE